MSTDPSPRHRTGFIVFMVVLAAIGSLSILAMTPPTPSYEAMLLAATLLAAAVIGGRVSMTLPGKSRIVISGELAPLITAAVVEPRWALPIAIIVCLLVPGASTSVRVLGGSQVLLSVIAACSLALLVPDASLAALTTLVVVAMLFVNVGLVLAYETFVWREPIQAMALGLLGSLVASTVVTIPIVALAAWLITQFGPVACAMMFIPLTATQYFNGLYQRKAQLTDELADKAEILARTNLQFAAAMVRALDTRDAYTAGHSAAVAVYTRDIAREMGFDDETIRMAHLAGLLHDIGKIGVPGRVLNKTAPLDDEEYELMKSHAAMGADILGEVDLYADIAILVRYHHERIDGRGYPEGIGGEAIPAISRMISVADTYSAMTTDRPYRDGMPAEKAMSILRECRGTQLDSDFTDAFLRILIVADDAYQRGKQTEFEVEVAKHQAMSQVEAETVRLNEPHPAGPVVPDVPMLPAAIDGELVEVELEREAA